MASCRQDRTTSNPNHSRSSTITMSHPMNQRADRFALTCADKTLELGGEAKIMGIVNTTPDSFYDGGSLQANAGGVNLDRALEQAMAMVCDGASIIDIGGESSRPGAETISAEEEIKRTVPLIARLRTSSDVLISIDTYKAEVAEAALRAGANIVNDISGFTFDSHLPAVCRRYRAAVVLMHAPIKPELMRWSTATSSGEDDILERVIRSLANSISIAEQHGIEQCIVDPGFGFGKSVAENFRLLGHLQRLHELGRPLLVGLSRKSFLGHAITDAGEPTAPPSERLAATIAANTVALMQGAAILRVHDVQAAMHCVRVVENIKSATD